MSFYKQLAKVEYAQKRTRILEKMLKHYGFWSLSAGRTNWGSFVNNSVDIDFELGNEVIIAINRVVLFRYFPWCGKKVHPKWLRGKILTAIAIGKKRYPDYVRESPWTSVKRAQLKASDAAQDLRNTLNKLQKTLKG